MPFNMVLTFEIEPNVVKLHSELALPNELQLARVGVDFVFPPSQLTSN